MEKDVLRKPQKRTNAKKVSIDPITTAKAVNLLYVNDAEEGITRIKKGKGFTYKYNKNEVKNKKQLDRIRALVIPPAWKDVWICAHANGHLQVTGKDKLNRKQYLYHPDWNIVRNETKFNKLIEFGKALPVIRKQVAKDLSEPNLSRNKVLAAVVSLMEKTGMRSGNEMYEKLYGSFGLTTLKDKHVKVNGTSIKFAFRGKKGVEQALTLHSKKLASIVKKCRDIPGKELFQYLDEEGKRQSIDSGMVNAYIKQIAGNDFTAKDFRTWCGSVIAFQAFKVVGNFETEQEAKKNIIAVLDIVSLQLGNTRTVCKKYYVHPVLPELYEKGEMEKWLSKMPNSKAKAKTGLLSEEKILINILRSKSN